MQKHKKRPFQTLYFDSIDGVVVVSQGHSATEKGAVRGAIVNVFTADHAMARIHRDGVCLYTVRPTKRGYVVNYGRSGGAK